MPELAKSPSESELRDSKVPRCDTLQDLTKYIDGLVDRKHDYGTCVYAMSLSAVAAFNFVAHKLGVTGFQASCADLDILKRTRHLDGPFMIIKAEDALFPQYDLRGKLDEALSEWKDWLGEEAVKKLSESPTASPNILRHWLYLAITAGKNGFDQKEILARADFLENEFTPEFIGKNADQFKRFGINDVYLRHGADIRIAEKCKEGAAFRISMPVSLQFEATIAGVRVYWFVDTERKDSNGTGALNFNWNLLLSLERSATGEVKSAIQSYIEKARKTVTNPTDK